MADSPIKLEIEVDKRSLARWKKASQKDIEQAAVQTTLILLDKLEDATLIRRYTQNSRPAKPTNSTYVRTFNLQDSSSKQLIRDTLPVEGEWRADVEYASYVIGTVDQQADIHIGRWPSLELGMNNVEVNANKVFTEEMDKVQK